MIVVVFLAAFCDWFVYFFQDDQLLEYRGLADTRVPNQSLQFV